MNVDEVAAANCRIEEKQYVRYDRQAIARYCRSRPWLVLWRAVRIAWLFGNFLFRLSIDNWTNRVKENQPKRATEVRQILTSRFAFFTT